MQHLLRAPAFNFVPPRIDWQLVNSDDEDTIMTKTILIVDDEHSIVVPFELLMEQNGHYVLFSKRG